MYIKKIYIYIDIDINTYVYICIYIFMYIFIYIYVIPANFVCVRVRTGVRLRVSLVNASCHTYAACSVLQCVFCSILHVWGIRHVTHVRDIAYT